MDEFEALADPVRRSILLRLRTGPARVVDLAGDQKISRPAVSRHLRVLTDAGLCAVETRGRERHYRLARGGLSTVQGFLDALAAPAAPFAEAALDGLELEVRRTVHDAATTARTPHHHQEETG